MKVACAPTSMQPSHSFSWNCEPLCLRWWFGRACEDGRRCSQLLLKLIQ